VQPRLQPRPAAPQSIAASLPPGWKLVESKSRPGKWTYLDTETGLRYEKLPREVRHELDLAKKGLFSVKEEDDHSRCSRLPETSEHSKSGLAMVVTRI
jgi:hypothetical protein